MRSVCDPVTGEWHGGAVRLAGMQVPVIIVTDWDQSRHEFPHTPCPVRIHRHGTDGRLGSPPLSPEASRYWGGKMGKSAKPKSYWQWWSGDDAVRALISYFGPETTFAVLSVRRDGKSWQQAAEDSGIAIKTLIAADRDMARAMRPSNRQQRAA